MQFLLAMMLQLAAGQFDTTVDSFSSVDEPTGEAVTISIVIEFETEDEMSDVSVMDGFTTLELDYSVLGVGAIYNDDTQKGLIYIYLEIYPDDLQEGDEDVNVIFSAGDTLYRHRLVINDANRSE